MVSQYMLQMPLGILSSLALTSLSPILTGWNQPYIAPQGGGGDPKSLPPSSPTALKGGHCPV